MYCKSLIDVGYGYHGGSCNVLFLCYVYTLNNYSSDPTDSLTDKFKVDTEAVDPRDSIYVFLSIALSFYVS